MPIYADDATHHDRCWATIITSPSFVLGAIALGHSLNTNSSSSAASKIALVTAQLPFVDRCVLSAAGWLLRNVSVIPNPNAAHVPHFSSVYSKLHVFALEHLCGRVVYIDADVVAVDVCPLLSCACFLLCHVSLALMLCRRVPPPNYLMSTCKVTLTPPSPLMFVIYRRLYFGRIA